MMDLATACLVVGYVLAVPTTAMVLRIAWRRWTAAFATLLVGNALVVLGWAMKGRRLPAWMNAGFFIGFVCTWIVVNRIRERRIPRDTHPSQPD